MNFLIDMYDIVGDVLTVSLGVDLKEVELGTQVVMWMRSLRV